jgi:hypothetical protein
VFDSKRQSGYDFGLFIGVVAARWVLVVSSSRSKSGLIRGNRKEICVVEIRFAN